MKVVYFKLLSGGQPRQPVRAYEGDAGFDLFVSREAVINPGEFADVHTDVAVAMPKGIWGWITARSSTDREHGLLVRDGIIDNGYRGELFSRVFNPGKEPVVVPVGARLTQIIFMPLIAEEVEWQAVDRLPDSLRGTRGFGSSGR